MRRFAAFLQVLPAPRSSERGFVFWYWSEDGFIFCLLIVVCFVMIVASLNAKGEMGMKKEEGQDGGNMYGWRCGSCVFYFSETAEKGQCRCNPPQIFCVFSPRSSETQPFTSIAVWPPVAVNHWCGKYEGEDWE